jgi:hypothetical protein
MQMRFREMNVALMTSSQKWFLLEDGALLKYKSGQLAHQPFLDHLRKNNGRVTCCVETPKTLGHQKKLERLFVVKILNTETEVGLHFCDKKVCTFPLYGEFVCYNAPLPDPEYVRKKKKTQGGKKSPSDSSNDKTGSDDIEKNDSGGS